MAKYGDVSKTVEKASLTDKPMESRREKRYRLSAPAVFSWETAEGISGKGEGMTLNLSSNGAFISTQTEPPTGARIELNVYFPSLPGRSKPVRLHGIGVVIRAAYEDKTQLSFAAEIIFDPDCSDRIVLRNSMVN